MRRYGPLFARLRSKEWLLTPKAITVTKGSAQANAFVVAGGYAVPVVFADDSSPTEVAINIPSAAGGHGNVTVMHVGGAISQVACTAHKGALLTELRVVVPTTQGCALVLVSRAD